MYIKCYKPRVWACAGHPNHRLLCVPSKQIINCFVILFCSVICLSLFNVYANFLLNSSIRKGNICVVSTLVCVYFFKINIDYQLQAPLCKNMSVLKLQDNHSSSEWFSIVN